MMINFRHKFSISVSLGTRLSESWMFSSSVENNSVVTKTPVTCVELPSKANYVSRFLATGKPGWLVDGQEKA